MSIIGFTVINGLRHDFSSVTVMIDGLEYTGVKEVSWNHGLEPTAVRGNNPGKTGRTRGVYDAEAKITLYEAESNLLMAALSAKGALSGFGYMETTFDVVVHRLEAFCPIITANIIGCRIKKVDHQASEGADALAVAFDLDVMRIEENKLTPYLRNLVK